MILNQISNGINAFQFWYQSGESAPTEYIWIISNSIDAALAQFKQHYSGFFDYADAPCDVVPESEFEAEHQTGEILGSRSII